MAYKWLRGILLAVIFVQPPAPHVSAAELLNFVLEVGAGDRPVDVAVASSGNFYALDSKNSRIYVFNPDGAPRMNFGERGGGSAQLKNPQSLAISPRDEVIVADTGNHRIKVFNQAGKLIFQFGGYGPKYGQFHSPRAVAVDSFGLIFVADKGNQRVQVFSPNGVFLREFGLEYEPVDIAVDPQGFVYVLMPQTGKVVKFTSAGRKIKEITCFKSEHNYVYEAAGMTVDIRGDIYVTERAKHTVKKFNQDEALLLTFGSEGSGRGQFQNAAGLTADSDGDVLIADSGNGRVQVMRVSGSDKKEVAEAEDSSLVLDFYTIIPAEESTIDVFSLPGRGLYFLSYRSGHIFLKGQEERLIGREGDKMGEFKNPRALFVSMDGKIFVSDAGNHRLQIFHADGTPLYEFGGKGDRPGEFRNPCGVVVNSKGKIYVADEGNDRIQVFSNDGIFLYAYGQGGAGDLTNDPAQAKLNGPTELAVDSRDRLYVVDNEGTRIQMFDEEGRYLARLDNSGERSVSFGKVTDVAVDENDNVYVADQKQNRLYIFDGKGKFLFSFGSFGEGRGYFHEIAAVAASQGKIYVSDYKSRLVQVFRYSPDGILRDGVRLYATRSARLPEGVEVNDTIRYGMAKKEAMTEAFKELKKDLKISEEELKALIRVESVEASPDGEVEVTVSMPRRVLNSVETVNRDVENPESQVTSK